MKFKRIAEPGHLGTEVYFFECPASTCSFHYIVVQGPEPTWEFNGDVSCPTVRPSIRARIPASDGYPEYCCHFFIRNGMIEFLSDCSHELKGQTMEIPDWDEE